MGLLKDIRIRDVVLISICTIAVYLNSLTGRFVWDDILLVVHNDFIKGWRLLPEIFLQPLFYFTKPEALYYRPLYTLSYAFDYTLWGLNPLGFHLTNCILHLCVALLVYRLLKHLSQDRAVALLAALLFSVHPVNTTAVSYISGRADMLLAISAILCLIFYLRGLYIAAFVCFAFALLSKETALVIVLFIIVINETRIRMRHLMPEKPGVSRLWYLVFAAAAILYLFLRASSPALYVDIIPKGGYAGFAVTVFTFLRVALYYLRVLIFPVGLHMLSVVTIPVLGKPVFVIAAVLFIFISLGLLVLLWKKNKLFFLFLSFFLVWILPVISIAFRNPEYYSQGLAIAEVHWLYIASIGIFAMAAVFFAGSGALRKVVFLLLLALFSVLSIRENTFWKDNLTFFTHTEKYVRYSPTVYTDLGLVYLNKGWLKKAQEAYLKALSLEKNKRSWDILYQNMAYTYFLSGDAAGLESWCPREEGKENSSAGSHSCLALAFSFTDMDKAKEEWLKALDKDPFSAIAFNNLVGLSVKDRQVEDYLLGKYNGMLLRYKGFSRYKIYRALAIIYLYNNKDKEAFASLQNASRINPYDVKVNSGLGVYFARQKDFSRAEKAFAVALKLNPYDKENYRNLAALYYQTGRQTEADALMKTSKTVNEFD